MEDHPLVLETPQPETFFEGFEDNSMEFKVQFWVNFMESQKAKSALASQIFDTLKESDIEASLQEEG